MFVEVRKPDGRGIRGARVEAWPLDPSSRDGEPLARAESLYGGLTVLRGVGKGDYAITANHPDFVEGRVEISGFDPEDYERNDPIVVRLRRGATVHGVATDEDEARVSGARLTLTLLDDPEARPGEPETPERAPTKQGDTDATGHAWLRGIPPGLYRLEGEMRGPDAAARAVKFRREGRLHSSLELDLVDEAQEEVDVAVVAAGSVRGRLACTDGLAIPAAASVLTVTAGTDLTGRDADDLARDAALWEGELGLIGPARDALVVGPLEGGAYHLAVRPAGHDRWTWALGTEQAVDAIAFLTVEGEETDLETIAVECGPAIRVSPVVGSRQPLPDVRGLQLDGEPLSVRGTVSTVSGRVEIERVRVEARTDHLIVRDLPEGDAVLELTLTNDYFLPTTRLTIPVDATLQRGRTLSLSPAVTAIGGIVELSATAGVAARLENPDAGERIAVVSEGRARFAGVPEGSYRLEVCEDTECGTILETIEAVKVKPAKTIEVTTGS
jgi:hypothetical protein